MVGSYHRHPTPPRLVPIPRSPSPEFGPGEYGNTRSYDQRGWCHFEHGLASLVKDERCLWDLAQLDEMARGIAPDHTTL